jgi:hypothetical protein
MVTGETPDISEWVDFEFYDPVWYYDHKKMDMVDSGKRLARWLGIAHRIGSDLCYWLLLPNGSVIAPRTTVQHVTRTDLLESEEVKMQIERFDEQVEQRRLTDENFVVDNPSVAGFYLEDEINECSDDHALTDNEYGDMMTDDRPDNDDLTDEPMDNMLTPSLFLTMEMVMRNGSV